MAESVLHQILDRSGFSPVTKSRYRLVIDRWISFAGSDPLGWTRERAQDFYDHLIATVAVQSANTYILSLRYVSRWYAMRTGQLDFAIVQRQRGKKGRGREREGGPLIEVEEAQALLRTCENGSAIDRRDLALLVVGLETGMRRMSFLGLHAEAIHHTRNFPSVLVPIKGPGGEETFDVPLSDTAFAALRSWVDWLKKQRIASGPVFRKLAYGRLGDVLTPTGINELLETRSSAANIRRINPHMLRHTFISWRNRAGFLPIDIGEITGHKVKTYVVDGMAMKIGGMNTYFHREIEPIRSATPPWLAQLVSDLIKGF
jgi:integrase